MRRSPRPRNSPARAGRRQRVAPAVGEPLDSRANGRWEARAAEAQSRGSRRRPTRPRRSRTPRARNKRRGRSDHRRRSADQRGRRQCPGHRRRSLRGASACQREQAPDGTSRRPCDHGRTAAFARGPRPGLDPGIRRVRLLLDSTLPVIRSADRASLRAELERGRWLQRQRANDARTDLVESRETCSPGGSGIRGAREPRR